MLDLPLVVTPFLVGLVLFAGLVAAEWFKQRGAPKRRMTVLVTVGVLCAWGALVVGVDAVRNYYELPPNLPAAK